MGGPSLRVLVGGFGLGFTLAELQRDERVSDVVVAELGAAMESDFCNVEVLTFPVQLQQREEHYLLYLSRLMS